MATRRIYGGGVTGKQFDIRDEDSATEIVAIGRNVEERQLDSLFNSCKT